MKKIFKYPIYMTGTTYVDMPVGAEIISVIVQQGQTVVYALVNPDEQKERVSLISFGTGWELQEHDLANTKFIGTVQDSYGHVWHVFYRKGQPLQGNYAIEVQDNCFVCSGELKHTNTEILPLFVECTQCTMKSEYRNEEIFIIELEGQSFVFDEAVGEETNAEIEERLERLIDQVRKEKGYEEPKLKSQE